MGTISVTLPTDGTTADVADINNPITTIVNEINGNISDINISSSAAIDGSKLANSSVGSTKLNFGGSGAGVWWEEIGRTSLSVAGDTIAVASLPVRKYLQIRVTILPSGNVTPYLRFNNDTANNYAFRFDANNGTTSSNTSTGSIVVGPDNTTNLSTSTLDVLNFQTSEKLLSVKTTTNGGTVGAGTLPGSFEVDAKWSNIVDYINQVTIYNSVGTGDFAIGSDVIVLGHN